MTTWPAFAPTLSQAEVHELTDASHFLQEDAPERILHVLLAFLERPRRPPRLSARPVQIQPRGQAVEGSC